MRTLDQVDTISAKDKELLEDLKRIIRRLLPTVTILLYGSVARGTQDPESDYDLLVLTDRPLGEGERDSIEKEIYSLELDRQVILATVYHTWDEWEMPIVRGSPFYEEVTRDAIKL